MNRLQVEMSSIQRSVARELMVITVLAAAYLTLVPERPISVDLALALFALGLIGVTAKHTRARVWNAPVAPRADRLRHSTLHMLVGSAAVTLLFGAFAIVSATDVLARLFRPTLLVGLVLFIPWALLQQTLFQFYLLGRLRVLLPGASRFAVASVNGLLFAAVHLPDWRVAILTAVGGGVWSWYYDRDRCLLPLALSHAVLGTIYFYWVRDADLALSWFGVLSR